MIRDVIVTAYKWFTVLIHVKCKYKCIYIGSRGDRYGANSIPWFTAITYSYLTNVPLYHRCSKNCERYKNNVSHKILMKYSLQGTCDDLHDTRKTLITKDLDGWMYGFVNLLMDCGNEKALPDAVAETKLKQLFFDEFESEAKRHEWQLKWRPESSCVIHVRLDDMRLHSNFDNQKFIGEEALSSLILNTHNRFPSHDIQIVTSPKKEDQILCEDIVKRSGVKCNVIGNDNVDYDLWLMMHCDILIMSRSTFSFIAGLLHQGSEVYTYEKWSHFDEIVGSYHPKYKGKNISKVFKVL